MSIEGKGLLSMIMQPGEKETEVALEDESG